MKKLAIVSLVAVLLTLQSFGQQAAAQTAAKPAAFVGGGSLVRPKSLPQALLLGFLLWLIPFLVAFLIYPIRLSTPALFESIMPVVISICVVLFSILYFRNLQTAFVKEGITLGVLWIVISLALDLPIFMEGPMKMGLIDYLMDIGLTYLIIPTVTVGFGYARRAT